MPNLKDILESLSALLGIIASITAIILYLREQNRVTRRKITRLQTTRVPWVWIFVVAGIFTGIGVNGRFDNPFLGFSATLLTVSIGLIIHSVSTNRSKSYIDIKYKRLTKGLRRIVHLLPSEFKILNWKIIYSIGDDGSDQTTERLTIFPAKDHVYFYFKRYELISNPTKKEINLTVRNLIDNTDLVAFELERNEKEVYFVILLDPPSTVTSPKTIEIKCDREGIWDSLLTDGVHDGSITITHECDILEIEFQAPRGKKWKGLHQAPLIGNIQQDTSRIFWTLENIQPRQYTYDVFLEEDNR